MQPLPVDNFFCENKNRLDKSVFEFGRNYFYTKKQEENFLKLK